MVDSNILHIAELMKNPDVSKLELAMALENLQFGSPLSSTHSNSTSSNKTIKSQINQKHNPILNQFEGNQKMKQINKESGNENYNKYTAKEEEKEKINEKDFQNELVSSSLLNKNNRSKIINKKENKISQDKNSLLDNNEKIEQWSDKNNVQENDIKSTFCYNEESSEIGEKFESLLI